MLSLRSTSLLITALCATLSFLPAASAAPALQERQSSPNFWMADINRTPGTVWGNPNTTYKIFRNVVDFGAKGNGQADDTEAINKAISSGGRCGDGCNSSTIQPAIVYFPPGTYRVSKPIIMFYYTQLIGDALNKPIIKADPDFTGMALLDSDPYKDGGANWYINQNNFFRQVRNFVIDLTPAPAAAGIHWQVAQATSLQNIDFKMTEGGNQQGIFMDNGSGGWMSDLTFEGGKIGAFLGSQQFTTRNLKFTNCQTAIVMNWNWGWVLNNVSISGGTVGLDMAANPTNQSTGSVLLSDSVISGTTYGVNTSFSMTGNVPATGNTLVLDNVDMSTCQQAAVWSAKTKSSVLAPGKIEAWAQGNGYDHTASGKRTQGPISKAKKSTQLLDGAGNIFGRSKPQYEDLPVGSFKSVKTDGRCKGDGQTDDTACIQKFLETVAGTADAVAYFDHGAYLLKDTVTVPNKIKIVGEIWSLIVADGASFNNVKKPKPVWQVGKRNGGNINGGVEISDLMFETKGPAPGAIMIEWNLNSANGESGMWDSHVRIGGSYGTELSEAQCPGWPTTEPTPECQGVFLMFHARPESGGIYLENTWFWVADHDLEVNNQTQISLYSARGFLLQSKGPVWLWGTASEHSVIYNYQFDGAQAVFGGFMQTETPYFQPNPEVPQPFDFNSQYDDPTFTICTNGTDSSGVPCKDAWGLRVVNSKNILIYATGMYSFFNNYAQACVPLQNCQEHMIRIQNSQVDMYTVTTKAAVKMLDDSAVGAPILGADNRNIFGDTLAWYRTG
ncbi:glycoside hydrolase family 55 protein [Pseudocercospora fijiensis CIRAD86]|uniref:Glycoside hydrolase family 55 protein n=1 Tax=Pseudocercospora fijiensis (strain CIRAD86) TaxID=383855 RepID=M3B7Z5_PSEFD|nr:glycoside hydrolase family 55 protein [Pseudocercospora fijiensis CIRAD86]EME85443.1 glycoside hydrolase family 55 protein [Pseudocercospora fijiensis CIRAD86]